ncbi:hypothetical protein SAY87_028408 [Trapa incisa]|uniref:Folate-biopterin transporter 7 n=1 Tax=Trapa incisa TaxID=236973 RepID=A0AAN7QNM4_9MYRT|nr:hypothetical protein SAY87_028408 [Trapa incisa]
MVIEDGSSSRSRSKLIQKIVLGVGFLVQGLRCFPWMAVNFFLKDALNVEPSTLQILQNTVNLPMVVKPLYGIISDTFYVGGQHRIPYIAFGALLQALSWLAIAILNPSDITVISMYLLLSNIGASITEVANDAMVAELGKQQTTSSKRKPRSSTSGELQSFVWMVSSAGGVIGNLLGGMATGRTSSHAMFMFFGILLAIQFLVTISFHESCLNLPQSSTKVGMKKQFSDLASALKRPEMAYAITWFAASYAVIPTLTGTMFFYQTQYLKIDTSVLGLSKVFGQGMMLLWSVVYNRRLKSIPPRKLISTIQIVMAAFMLSDVLFVKGIYREIGLPNSIYVVVFSGLLEVLFFFKILPFSVLIAELCPPGCEGSIMAFLMSVVAFAFILSGYLGVLLASMVGVTGQNFSGLPVGIFVQAGATLLPLFWSYWIPTSTSLLTPTIRRKDE